MERGKDGVSTSWCLVLILGLISVPMSAGSDPVTADPALVDAEFPAGIAEIAIESHGARLNGIVYMAQGQGPHPTVVLLHGFPGNEKNLDLAQAMRRAGFNVLILSLPGVVGQRG